MTPQAAYNGPDPLEWARKQLDFEALAKRGPSSRDILFKAQTIVPLARPQLNHKPWGAAAGALLLLAALATPWLPQRSALLTAHLVLDQHFTRAQAQQVVYAAATRLSEEVLLGAEFTGKEPANGEDPGALKLAFTALDQSETDLAREVSWVFQHELSGRSVALQSPTRLQHTARTSPALLAWERLRALGKKREQPAAPGLQLARELVKHQALVLSGLRTALAHAGFSLSAGGYLDTSGTGSGSTYDLVLPAWPNPLGFSIENYSALGSKERAAIHRLAEGFIARMNLTPAPLAFTPKPQPWLPVLVEVRAANGAPDRLLTDRLQARIAQPKSEELSRYDFDVVRLVEAALDQALPQQECRIDYEALRPGLSQPRGDMYLVTVALTGKRTSSLREISGEEQVSGEDSIDW